MSFNFISIQEGRGVRDQGLGEQVGGIISLRTRVSFPSFEVEGLRVEVKKICLRITGNSGRNGGPNAKWKQDGTAPTKWPETPWELS